MPAWPVALADSLETIASKPKALAEPVALSKSASAVPAKTTELALPTVRMPMLGKAAALVSSSVPDETVVPQV